MPSKQNCSAKPHHATHHISLLSQTLKKPKPHHNQDVQDQEAGVRSFAHRGFLYLPASPGSFSRQDEEGAENGTCTANPVDKKKKKRKMFCLEAVTLSNTWRRDEAADGETPRSTGGSGQRGQNLRLPTAHFGSGSCAPFARAPAMQKVLLPSCCCGFLFPSPRLAILPKREPRDIGKHLSPSFAH